MSESKKPTLLADGQWYRASALSIVVDGWIALVAIIGFLLSQLAQITEDNFNPLELLLQYPFVAIALLFLFLSPTLRWYSTYFQVDEEYVRVKTGILNKRQNQARINRIQSIDVVQPFVARIVGLARLDFDVADSSANLLQVRYVPKDQAVELRAELLVRSGRKTTEPDTIHGFEDAQDTNASGASSQNTEHALERVRSSATQRIELARLPLWMVLVLTFGTVDMFFFVLGILGSFGLFFIPFGGSGFSPIIGLSLLVGMFGVLIPRLNRYWNFNLSWDGDGLRLSSGLSATMDQTLPAGRIQGVSIDQNIILRIFGLYQLNVNVAGFGGDTPSATGSVERSRILPAGRWEQVEKILPLILPDVPAENLPKIAHQLMHQDPNLAMAQPKKRALFHAPLAWPRLGAAINSGMFLARDGWLNRNAHLVSLNRLQGLKIVQGPIQRLFGTCTFHADIPLGQVRPYARHLPIEDASGMLHHALRAADFARRYSDREDWMDTQELAEFDRRTEELVHD